MPDVKQTVDHAGTAAGAPRRIKSLASSTLDIKRGAISATELPAGSAREAGRTAQALKMYGGGLGALGFAGSGLQTATGLKEMARGRYLAGTQDLSAGVLNSAAGATAASKNVSAGAAGSLRALGAAETLGTAASKVPVAAPIAGAASAITGGFDVAEGVRTGKPGKAALGGAKAIGGGLLVASAFAGPGAPVLATAGGAVLLGATAWENRKAIGKAASWAAHRVAGGAKFVAKNVGEGAKNVVQGVADGARSVSGAAKSAVNGVGDALGGLF